MKKIITLLTKRLRINEKHSGCSDSLSQYQYHPVRVLPSARLGTFGILHNHSGCSDVENKILCPVRGECFGQRSWAKCIESMNSLAGFFLITCLLTLFCNSPAHAEDGPNVSVQGSATAAPVVPATPTPALAPASQAQKPIIIDPISPDVATKEVANIYLNFVNASLLSVVNYLGEEKKINIIPHKDLEPTKITLTTLSPLTLDRAWNVLLTLLEMNGFSLIQVGDLFRVVSSKDNGQEPLPTYSSGSGTEPEDLPNNDKVVRYIYFFKSIKVSTAKSILSKMIDDKNIIENNDLNACIIKDQCLNIKAAMKIVKELDSTGLRESIEVIGLTWANADNVANLFKDILGTEKEERIIRFTPVQQKESAYFSTTTKIIPEPVRNALILLGTQKNVDKIKDFIYKYIDLPIDDAASRLHIKELRYVQAQDMKPILEGIIQIPKGAASDKGLVLEGGYKAFEDVIISAETNDDATAAAATASKRGGGNRLIIACNRDDWRRIESFIDKIDKPQPQVAIEVMIIDIDIDDLKDLGGQMFGIRGKPVARNVGTEFENLSNTLLKIKDPTAQANQYINLANTNPDNSASLLSFGRAGTNADNSNNNIWAMVQAIMESTNAHIIDQPYIIANNNQKCSVSISKIFRVKGQVSSSSNSPVQNFEDLAATIKAEFTPTINLTGTVDLTIDISINEFTQAPSSDQSQATKTNRLITTKASMGAGEVLILGGLKRDAIQENVWRTPILSEIPIIGSLLFKRKSKRKVDSNLYVFIRPSIIKPKFEGSPDEYTQLKLDYAKYQVMRGDTYVQDTDPIQRWFFKPSDQTIKQKISDASRGILRSVDDFTYGRNRPKSVNILEDPYFTVSEAVTRRREEEALEKAKRAKSAITARQAELLSRPRATIVG